MSKCVDLFVSVASSPIVADMEPTNAHPIADQVLTPEETAQYLKVPLRTLDAWRYRRTGPAYMKVGRHIRYRRSDVDAFLADLVVG